MVVRQAQQPVRNLVVLGAAPTDVPITGLADPKCLTCQPGKRLSLAVSPFTRA